MVVSAVLRSLSITLGALAAAAASDSVAIQGAGATFPAPLYAKWLDAYNKAHSESHIDYQPIGSGGGIKGITDKTVQFAGSDAPLSEDQLKAAPGIVHLPTVAGPVVMIYHHQKLEGVTLTFDAQTIAGIYLGTITTWNDAHIAATNPGLKLPADDIVVVHRSDGSGTSYIFTDYLAKVSPEWAKKAGKGTSVKWPTGIGGKGSAGVAEAVSNSMGAIGYAELAFAKSAKLPYAKVVNHDGKAIEASIDAVNEAAKNSPAPPDDLRLSITDAPGEASYPICGFTYLLVYQDLSYLKSPGQAKAIAQFIDWAEHDGQGMAAPDYARLPEAMQAKVGDKLRTIAVDGKPLLEAPAPK
jgi:phosphate transport system substrate-binding protein